MVETVSASTLPQGTGNGSAAQLLEPGTELKARVEGNLPGGVVRLATAEGKVELRVATPLPADAQVTVTVSGTRQQPVIQITTDKPPAQAGQQAGTPAQGQGGQPSQASPPQTNAGLQGGGQTGGTPAVPVQAGAARPVITSTPAGAHLVQVLPATANAPAGGGFPAGQVGTGAAAASAPGQAGPSAPAPLPGQAPVTVTNAPPAASAPSPAATGPVATPAATPAGAGSSASLQNVASPPQGPAQAALAAAPLPGGGASTAPAAQGPLPGGQAVAPQVPPVAVGQPTAPSQGGPFPAGATPGTGAPAPAPGSAATPAGVPLAQTASQPGAQATAQTSPLQVTGNLQPGPSLPAGTPAQAGPAAALQASISTGQGQPTPPAGTPAGGSPARAQLGTLGAQAQPAPQSVAGQGSAAAPVPTGPQQPGVPQPAPGTAPFTPATASGATPVPQATGTAQPAPPGLQAGGQGAALATLTAGSGGLGLQQGAAPVRILSGQPYQQLGSQPLGGAAGPTAGQPATNAGAAPAAQVAGALRQPLAEQQAGLTSLFAQIGSLTSAQGAGSVTLPDSVMKAMQQILGLRLNMSGSTSAGDLQQAVRQSGQFREAQLALPGGGSGAVPDLKSALLSLKSLLQQLGARPEISRPAGQPAAPSRHSPPQGQAPQQASGYWAGAAPQNLQALLKEADAALARLRLTQLANTGLARDSAPQATSKPMDLVLELPLALGQETAVMQMQIGRDGPGNQNEEEGEPAWRLRFALDLTATGPLEAAISLRGGGTYASLWVDRKETFDSLNAVRETMEAAFADAGLDLQELRLIRGLPPKTAAYYGAMVDRQS